MLLSSVLRWACSLAWIGRQSPKLQIAGSNPARSVTTFYSTLQNETKNIKGTKSIRTMLIQKMVLLGGGSDEIRRREYKIY
jgi:hypothetical protein